jgi:NADH-quinone oxidoreductase subunit J
MLLSVFIVKHPFREQMPSLQLPSDKVINHVGIGLMTDYVLPFEVAGILLLVALIGAAIIASTIKSKKV